MSNEANIAEQNVVVTNADTCRRCFVTRVLVVWGKGRGYWPQISHPTTSGAPAANDAEVFFVKPVRALVGPVDHGKPAARDLIEQPPRGGFRKFILLPGIHRRILLFFVNGSSVIQYPVVRSLGGGSVRMRHESTGAGNKTRRGWFSVVKNITIFNLKRPQKPTQVIEPKASSGISGHGLGWVFKPAPPTRRPR
jgi:hypothetical protein